MRPILPDDLRIISQVWLLGARQDVQFAHLDILSTISNSLTEYLMQGGKSFYTMRYEPVLKSCHQYILRHHKSATIFFIFAAFFVAFFHKGLITGTFYALGDPF